MHSPVAAPPVLSSADITLAYHARTKHRLARYAAGPETLDWDSQPDPFREFAGCPRTPLPLNSDHLDTSFAELTAPNGRAGPLSIASVATLLELSLGLSAWKQYGPDRWALRCNPSSGNLHPTEAYVIAANVPALDDGLYHYVSRDHALELRCRRAERSAGPPLLWIGFSSVHWREAWKYGERAFRYAQLDIGHALGAVRYAAAALGWRAQLVEDLDGAAVAARLGLDRAADFAGVEAEDPELLIAIDADAAATSPAPAIAPPAFGAADLWAGRANRLDPRPLYRWPVISEVAAATTGTGRDLPAAALSYPPLGEPLPQHTSSLLLRSAF